MYTRCLLLFSVSGLNLACIVSHHLAYAFLSSILPQASLSPSSSFIAGGSLIVPSPLSYSSQLFFSSPSPQSISSSRKGGDGAGLLQSQTAANRATSSSSSSNSSQGAIGDSSRVSSCRLFLSAVPELFLEIFALGLGVTWEPSYLATRRQSHFYLSFICLSLIYL